jgi:hypothetical protein
MKEISREGAKKAKIAKFYFAVVAPLCETCPYDVDASAQQAQNGSTEQTISKGRLRS